VEEKTIITGITGEFFDRVVAPAEIGQKVRSYLQCGTCTASCCPFCEMNLTDALGLGDGLHVLDLVELVLESASD
jgi:hypothetical protein